VCRSRAKALSTDGSSSTITIPVEPSPGSVCNSSAKSPRLIAKAPEAAAVEEFQLNDEQRKRLVLQEVLSSKRPRPRLFPAACVDPRAEHFQEARMTRNVLWKARTVVIRTFAVVAVLMTYAVENIGTQIATTVGVSTLALTTAAAPARGWWRRGDRNWRGWGWRRGYGWGRCWWGEWC